MHLPQLCSRKTELALEVKFYLNVYHDRASECRMRGWEGGVNWMEGWVNWVSVSRLAEVRTSNNRSFSSFDCAFFPSQDSCGSLFCSRGGKGCFSRKLPALDGSICGERKVCIRVTFSGSYGAMKVKPRNSRRVNSFFTLIGVEFQLCVITFF